MVYIRINRPNDPPIPKRYLQSVQVLTVEGDKYIQYKDFKKIEFDSQKNFYKHVTKNDIVSDIDMDRLIQLSKRTPEQRKMIQQLKTKHQHRLMSNSSIKANNIDSQSYYYGKVGQEFGGNNVKELTDSVSFGVTFIFSFFMAGITGYFFAQYFFHFQLAGRLMVSVVFIFATIFVETWLYIIKQTKANKKLEMERKKWEKNQSLKAQYTLKTGMKFKDNSKPGTKIKKQ